MPERNIILIIWDELISTRGLYDFRDFYCVHWGVHADFW